jgi:hypothetical protein
MGVIASVELLLDVSADEGADGVNELLRELQRHFTSTSCLVDYRIEGFRQAGQQTLDILPVGAYEEGLAFAKAPRAVERLVALSTAHLSEAGRLWVEAGMDGAIGHRTETGGFLYVGDVSGVRDENRIPEEVQAILSWAEDEALTWVKFDCDGLVQPGLRVFE